VTEDPYLIPGSQTLLNLPGIVDPDRLAQFEADVTRVRMLELDAHPLPGRWDLKHLQGIHHHVFQDVYPWAGQLRTVDLAKGDHLFARPQFLVPSANDVFLRLAHHAYLRGLDRERFVAAAADLLGDINALHPFREGNGRAQRAYLAALAGDAGWQIAWERLDPEQNIAASIASHDGDNRLFRALLAELTQPAETPRLWMPSQRRPERPRADERQVLESPPRQPASAHSDERNPHLAAIEKPLPAPVRAVADPAAAPQKSSPPASAAAGARPVHSSRPSPSADVPTVRSPRPSPDGDVPTVEPPGPHGVRAPRHTQEDEQRRRDQLAREAAEQARPESERQQGPRQSQ
jgi:cell filamentation protein